MEGMREKKIALVSDTIVIDTLSLVPGTVTLLSAKGEAMDTTSYKTDYPKGEIIFFNRKTTNGSYLDSITVQYRVFPFLFTKEIRHKDVSLIRPDLYGNHDIFTYNPVKLSSGDVFKTDGLDKSGSISRGVSFGNNQDVIVNSNLNLQ